VVVHAMTEPYDEVVGHPSDRWALPKTIPCPTCKAPVNEKCVNPITGLPAHMACVARRPKVAS
jgi:hypothetical protein